MKDSNLNKIISIFFCARIGPVYWTLDIIDELVKLITVAEPE
jgi:hypothetical protein